MSQRISSYQIGTIYYQSGYGYPTHIATIGCTYIDVNTGTMYINKDGLDDWEEFVNNNDASLVIGTFSATTIQTNYFLSNSTGLTQSGGFTILSNLSTLNAVDDAGAAGLGVPLYGLYRNGNVVQIRIT